MRQQIASAVAAVIVGTMGSIAFADTTSSTLAGQKEVSIDGKALSNPYGRVADNTMHMPIWYVGRALDATGVAQSWDGNTHVWSMTMPPSLLANLSNLLKIIPIGDGNTSIVVNGTTVKKVNTFAATDPASGKDTVYMPIYYIQQILLGLGVVNTWDGTDWNIVTTPNVPLGPGTGNTLGGIGNTLGGIGNTLGNTLGGIL